MGSFLASASRNVVDIRSFLRDSAGGNSIKYTAVSGERHQIYIPAVSTESVDENGNPVVIKGPMAIQGAVHEMTTSDGKYKASICLKDVVRKADDGTVLNDGSCPFCDRVADAWSIFNYRKEQEEESCKLTGDARKQHMEKAKATFADERKSKDAKMYMYMLVVKFRTDAKGAPTIGDDGLPEYDLKVMKLSSSRVDKISQQLENAGTQMAGSEIIFGYPKSEDRRLVVSQSTTSPVFPGSQFTAKYPALLDKINADVAKFKWDGIEKSFPEWAGMTTDEAKSLTDSLFEKWDEYKKELTVNPNARYLEYLTSTPDEMPSINPGAPVVPQIPGAPAVPGAGQGAPVMPQAPTMDPNAMFAGITPGAPTI